MGFWISRSRPLLVELVSRLGELLGRVLSLAKGLFEDVCDLVLAELFGERREVAVRGDLVVFVFVADGDDISAQDLAVVLMSSMGGSSDTTSGKKRLLNVR